MLLGSGAAVPNGDAEKGNIASPPRKIAVLEGFRVVNWRLGLETGESSCIEARGIHRVEEKERAAKTTLSPLQIVLLWLSINTAAQNIALAMIGQSVYGLGYVDAALCSVFGGIAGSILEAYIATWGPVSGNRTLVSELFNKNLVD
jgi:hypothetical protein